MFIYPRSGARGLQILICLKYYEMGNQIIYPIAQCCQFSIFWPGRDIIVGCDQTHLCGSTPILLHTPACGKQRLLACLFLVFIRYFLQVSRYPPSWRNSQLVHLCKPNRLCTVHVRNACMCRWDCEHVLHHVHTVHCEPKFVVFLCKHKENYMHCVTAYSREGSVTECLAVLHMGQLLSLIVI